MPSVWKRAMVYLGLADDEEYADYGDYDDVAPVAQPGAQAAGYPGAAQPYPAAQPQPAYPPAGGQYQGSYGPEASPVRMIPRDEPLPVQPEPTPFSSSAVRTIPQPSARLHVMTPTSFNEAREIGERFKARAPVIINLAETERKTARRLLDFASGLTYALSGKIRPIGEGVFLLTPSGVEVSAEDKRRLRETGMLFDDLDS